ncbi:DUF5681 domain-containing protein [Methylobacterium iners]|uniref:DUF5681 domain-containing protein n=1 Tax=Methylobacterium iners TaxID=418707 RepID=A0ABQ4S7R9_9HYPH|nr:DUF5681 domain-containing protein [Methylobacterium iners]GJD97812.1 hypothetical protein OCOJLMKI_5051 [Methylobacterium iners]
MSEMPPKRPRRHTEPEYEVGYGRPPLKTRFKPGQCGNPKGRPKKPRSLPAAAERELDRMVIVREGGREKRLTKREVIGRRIVDDACRGDPRAIRLVRDLTGLSTSVGTDSQSHNPVPSVPLNGTDRTIIAAFATLIRSGATLLDASAEATTQERGLNDDIAEPEQDTIHPSSPTSH